MTLEQALLKIIELQDALFQNLKAEYQKLAASQPPIIINRSYPLDETGFKYNYGPSATSYGRTDK